ncbi:aldo/keto reductase [Arcticibacter tournemirensis]|uniref:Aldo/keto reductase n=1 Tax=Arcticibacter tournemirensis TaxID=699437 RepID=A0A4Q0M2L7_9SPHI|nr:aldo/keto reductase [Arcticibacter tournemirensis]RXF67074.1 aldo/keto reductase [Arcticibacter tournemirensis]
MEYTQLGKSELKVSQIGFGCMSLGTDLETGRGIIERAIELGINYFDTADLYDKGLNEEILGTILKDKRDKIVLATKVGNQWRADGSGWDWNPRKEYIIKTSEESLRRLKTDYIDLYQLHGGTIDDNIDETIEAFEILKQQGKIRYYGISSIRPNVIREYAQRSQIVSVMMQYSLLDRRPEESCLDFLLQKNISVVTRGSVAQGLLTGKPPKTYLNYDDEEVDTIAKAVRFVGGEKRSPAQTALHYVLQQQAVASAVVGIRTIVQLQDAAGTPSTPLLTKAEINFLREAIKQNYYEQHR